MSSCLCKVAEEAVSRRKTAGKCKKRSNVDDRKTVCSGVGFSVSGTIFIYQVLRSLRNGFSMYMCANVEKIMVNPIAKKNIANSDGILTAVIKSRSVVPNTTTAATAIKGK